MNQKKVTSKRDSQSSSKSRGASSFRGYANGSKSSSHKRNALTSKLDYKRIGLGFVMIGILLGAIVGYTAWHSLTVNAMKNWTYVGTATQFQAPGTTNATADSNQVVVAVYACKQQVSDISGSDGTYNVKARAKVTQNSVGSSFGNPRLEIVSDGVGSTRYITSPAIISTASIGTETMTPYTTATIKGTATLYYAFNNFYENSNGGTGLYAFGSIAKLNNC